MSAEFVVLGPDARVQINGTFFGVTGGHYRVTQEVKDRTDVDATAKENRASLFRQLDLTLSGQLQSNVTYGAGPLLLTARGAVLAVVLWLAGTTAPDLKVQVPQLVVKEFGGDWGLGGSAPQTINLQGVSSGEFTLPGEA